MVVVYLKLWKQNDKYIIERPQELTIADEMVLDHGEHLYVDVKIIDKRNMSDKQRRFIFKLCQEVEDYSGIDKELFRLETMIKNNRENELEKISLTQYSMKDANNLVDLIIEFFIENEIPLDKRILEENDFSLEQRHIYMMCLKRKCAVCSRHADLHHVDTVGMGRDRKKISHVGLRMLPLCRVHHNQAHNIGDTEFMKLYHLEPIVIDEKLEWFIKKGTLKTWNKE